jgi:hypothetical protein
LSADGREPSLPPGIAARSGGVDMRRMSAAVLIKVAPAASQRLLADVNAFGERDDRDVRVPALSRLEESLGREFADRLVAALSAEPKR